MSIKEFMFPAIFRNDGPDYIGVTFPDLPGAVTVGNDAAEAYRMAVECMSLHLYGMLEDNDEIPAPSNPAAVELPPNSSLVLIQSRVAHIHDELQRRAVTKNCTLPLWLRDAADHAGINYSQTLQEALKEKLGIHEK